MKVLEVVQIAGRSVIVGKLDEGSRWALWAEYVDALRLASATGMDVLFYLTGGRLMLVHPRDSLDAMLDWWDANYGVKVERPPVDLAVPQTSEGRTSD